jgi:hypothetical protein
MSKTHEVYLIQKNHDKSKPHLATLHRLCNVDEKGFRVIFQVNTSTRISIPIYNVEEMKKYGLPISVEFKDKGYNLEDIEVHWESLANEDVTVCQKILPYLQEIIGKDQKEHNTDDINEILKKKKIK